MLRSQFSLPIYIDLGATFLYSVTGAMAAIRRRYDVVGLFSLALVTGVGGALIRDGVFIQSGPPAVMKDARYLIAVVAGCILAGLFGHRVDRVRKAFLIADALGLGAYAVVGVEKSLNADLSVVAAMIVGVVNACGGGLLRDVLVREEPLMFKPGEFYALAALLGSGVFVLLVRQVGQSAETAALLAIGATFVFRALAIVFNWKTTPISQMATSDLAPLPAPTASPVAAKDDKRPAKPNCS